MANLIFQSAITLVFSVISSYRNNFNLRKYHETFFFTTVLILQYSKQQFIRKKKKKSRKKYL